MNWDNLLGKLSKGLVIWVLYTMDFLCMLVWLTQVFPEITINPIRMPLIWDGVFLIVGTLFSFGITLFIVEDLD